MRFLRVAYAIETGGEEYEVRFYQPCSPHVIELYPPRAGEVRTIKNPKRIDGSWTYLPTLAQARLLDYVLREKGELVRMKLLRVTYTVETGGVGYGVVFNQYRTGVRLVTLSRDGELIKCIKNPKRVDGSYTYLPTVEQARLLVRAGGIDMFAQ